MGENDGDELFEIFLFWECFWIFLLKIRIESQGWIESVFAETLLAFFLWKITFFLLRII
jgi:hypothetical protein